MLIAQGLLFDFAVAVAFAHPPPPTPHGARALSLATRTHLCGRPVVFVGMHRIIASKHGNSTATEQCSHRREQRCHCGALRDHGVPLAPACSSASNVRGVLLGWCLKVGPRLAFGRRRCRDPRASGPPLGSGRCWCDAGASVAGCRWTVLGSPCANRAPWGGTRQPSPVGCTGSPRCISRVQHRNVWCQWYVNAACRACFLPAGLLACLN